MPMTEEEKFRYWIESAEDDMKSAHGTFLMECWLNSAIHCQQAIERLAKGLYGLYLNFDDIPHSHVILRIIEDFEDKLPSTISKEQREFFVELSRYYFDDRYPRNYDRLPKKIDKETAESILAQTKEAFAWLLTMKP